MNDTKYRVDFLIDNKVILEAKSVLLMPPVYSLQILTQIKHEKNKVGHLINFNVELLKDSIRCFINDLVDLLSLQHKDVYMWCCVSMMLLIYYGLI